MARKSTLLDKDIYFDESLERAPPLNRRDSYSTITTIDELDSPQNSFEMQNLSPVLSGKAYMIPKIICFPAERNTREEEEKEESLQKMPLIQKAKIAPDPMNTGELYENDKASFSCDNISVSPVDRWSSQSMDFKSPTPKKDKRPILARNSPSHWKNEKGTDKDSVPRHRSGRPLLRRGISIGLQQLLPPVRTAVPSFTGDRMEI